MDDVREAVQVDGGIVVGHDGSKCSQEALVWAGALAARADLDLQISLLAEHEITRLIDLTTRIAEHVGVAASDDPELGELRRDVEPGAVIYRPGEPSDALYVVQRGAFTVHYANDHEDAGETTHVRTNSVYQSVEDRDAMVRALDGLATAVDTPNCHS